MPARSRAPCPLPLFTDAGGIGFIGAQDIPAAQVQVFRHPWLDTQAPSVVHGTHVNVDVLQRRPPPQSEVARQSPGTHRLLTHRWFAP